MRSVLITGGRYFNKRDLLFSELNRLHNEEEIVTIIHGDANGADSLGAQWAYERGIEQLIFPAEWKKYGGMAGPIRNRKMLNEKPDLVVAFPGGKGTANMVRIAKCDKVQIIEIEE